MSAMHYDTLTIPEATRLQRLLREKLVIQPRDLPVHIIGGADISFNRFSPTVYAGIVLLRFPDLQPLTYSLVKKDVHFPYIPGYLAFREVPALMEAWAQLPQKPDVLVVDGHGIAHPRRMGIAAHFGALSGQASIGCAKKLLFGTYAEPGMERGAHTPLLHQEEVIGSVLRTKAHVKPVFVSPGHLMDVGGSLSLIMQCTGRYRLPEPTRLAHNVVNLFRLGELPAGVTHLPSY